MAESAKSVEALGSRLFNGWPLFLTTQATSLTRTFERFLSFSFTVSYPFFSSVLSSQRLGFEPGGGGNSTLVLNPGWIPGKTFIMPMPQLAHSIFQKAQTTESLDVCNPFVLFHLLLAHFFFQ